MSKNTGNVVSFERSAAFMHRRAIKHRFSNPLDALDLMRQALDKSPDTLEYQIDMAEVYYEMGCFSPSIRLLVRALEDDNAPPECYYGLGLNFYGMNNLQATQYALASYLREAPEGEYREDAMELVAQIQFATGISTPDDRKRQRAETMIRHAEAMMENGFYQKAQQKLAESLSLYAGVRTRALLARAFAKQGKTRQAIKNARLVMKAERAPEGARIMAARAAALSGETSWAEEIVREVFFQDLPPALRRALIELMLEMGLHERANVCIRQALIDQPYDIFLLNAMAVSLVNMGSAYQQATPYWMRILTIDPDDALAAYYLSDAAKGNLTVPLSYAYTLPAPVNDAYRKRLRALGELASWQAESAWQEEGVQAVIRWALRSSDAADARIALDFLGKVERPEAVRLVRDCLLDPALPGAARCQAIGQLARRAPGQPCAVLTRDDFRLLRPGEAAAGQPPDSYFHVLWMAADKGRAMYGDIWQQLFVVWSTYAVFGDHKRLRSLNCWAAALLYMVRLRTGEETDGKQLSQVFRCGTRAMMHRVRMMECVLGKGEEF